MSETLVIIGGIAVGAMVAPLLVLLGMAFFYRAKGPENWDTATPLFTMAAMAAAVLVGAVSGIGVTRLFLEGRSQSAWVGIAMSAVLVLAMPAYILALPHLPLTPPKPADAKARARWARRTAGYPRRRDARRWEELGIGLAHDLRRTITEEPAPPVADSIIARRGPELRKLWAGLEPDARAALWGYTQYDPGWRWEVASESPPRILVVPDPLTGLAGPVFDVQRRRILRREHRDAPGFIVERTLPTVAAARRCLLAAGARAARAGRWDGTALGLRPLCDLRSNPPAGCPRTWLSGDARADGSWPFRAPVEGAWVAASIVEVEVRPAGRAGAAPFDMAFVWLEVGYLVDADGGWHMREGGPATADDPPPPPCLLDPAVPCD